MKKLLLLLLTILFTFSCSQKKKKNEIVSKPDAKTLMEESMQRFSTAWNQGNLGIDTDKPRAVGQ